ncbi:MAG: low-specificity L-threonine aldolase [Thermogutta sp.]
MTNDELLDFRSDTVTKPTPGMRAAMAAAEVGDDVLGDDPTMHKLEARVAELLGKEAAVFVPSGTMSNLIAVRVHCRPGDEMICEADAHIYNYEQGGYAQICGVAVRPVQGDWGIMQLEQVQGLIRPDNAHFVRTRLLTLENTHNRGGGRVQPYSLVQALTSWARSAGLRIHLDGARLWNAYVATGIAPSQWAQHFDTVNVCFSKGLGAPVGSALAGPRDLIAEARRHRKVLGGGMRQAGILAAAALYALDHHIERLAEDHANAKRLAMGLAEIPYIALMPIPVETNIILFDIAPEWGTAGAFSAALKEHGVLINATAPQRLRAVTHLDVTADDVKKALRAINHVATEHRGQ